MTILDKQTVASTLVKLRQKDLTPDEAEGLQRHLVNRIELLLATDDVEFDDLKFPKKYKMACIFLPPHLGTVPELAQDLAQSLGDAAEIPSILQYRSWIGGDRDGNPNVTHQITKSTIEALHAAARELWDAQLKELHRELSPSTRRTNLPEASNDLIEGKDQRRHEPLRLRIAALRHGIQEHVISAAKLQTELLAIRNDLIQAGLSRVANARPLTDAIVRSRAFGLHLAKLDIRQHSEVHLSALSELFRHAGIHDEFASLTESEK